MKYEAKQLDLGRDMLGCPPAQDASHHQDY